MCLRENNSIVFPVYLKQKQDNHNVEIADLFYMFNIVVALFTIGILSIGFLLNFFGRKTLIKLIEDEFSKEITAHQIDKLKENFEFNKVVKEIIAEQEASDSDVVDDPL